MQHSESLLKTDSQALKRVEIKGEVKRWCNAKYPMHPAIYLDILMPLKIIIIAFQIENHHPITAVRRITQFKVACRVEIWKEIHFVKIVTSFVTVLLKITFCLCIYFIFTKNPLF